MKVQETLYYITFHNCEGCFPQKFTEDFDYKKVKKQVDELNKTCNEYCSYSVGQKQVLVTKR